MKFEILMFFDVQSNLNNWDKNKIHFYFDVDLTKNGQLD